MSADRFIIEGEWTGYRSSQRRVVHRTVHPASFKKLRAWAEKTYAIRYNDGTSLLLTVRDCLPRERVQENHGYTRLINDCAHHDVCTVEALIAIEGEQKRANEARWEAQRQAKTAQGGAA